MDDHAETDLGVAALVSDRGYRHHRNEDAGDLAVVGAQVAVVVCDGVSSTANPDQASGAASQAAMAVLLAALNESSEGVLDAEVVLCRAVAAARHAVDDVPSSEPGGYPGAPSTTLVLALVAPRSVVVAGVGDSRAYWLPDQGSNRRLTIDDSWAEAAIAAGVPEPDAYAAPQAHVITNWIGGDAVDDDPAVVTVALDEPGLLVMCSDGLWNYLPGADDLAAVVTDVAVAEGTSRALAVAGRLVGVALDAGGSDNITVAVVEAGPRPSQAASP